MFPDQNGTWRTLAVGVKDEGFKSRLAIKEEWRALRDQDLEAKSGIEGAVFVHASGFIGGCKNHVGALKMAVDTINNA